MPDTDSRTDESFDLNRYRQAADVAYRYAKNKIEKEKSSDKPEDDGFSKEEEQESKP